MIQEKFLNKNDNEKNRSNISKFSKIILSTIDVLPKHHAGGPGKIVTLIVSNSQNIQNKIISCLPGFNTTSINKTSLLKSLKKTLIKLPIFKEEIKSISHFTHILKKQLEIKDGLGKMSDDELKNTAIFHAHDIFSFNAIKKFLDKKKISKPILLTLHSPGSYAQEFKQENPRAFATRFFLNYISKIEKNAINNCKLLTTPSQGTLDLIIADNTKLLDIKNKISTKHSIIFNGIMPPQIEANPKDHIDLDHKRYILSSGRLVHSKGFDLAIQGFAELITQYPQAKNTKLFIIGEGPLKNSLKELCVDLGVSESVEFLGFRKDAMRFLKHAQLFIATTRRSALDLTILEALHLGIPVIATDTGGNSEALKDGQGGIIVPTAEPKALAKALNELLSNDSIRNKLSLEGLNKAQKKFSIEAMIHSYCDLYDKYRHE